MLRQLQRRRDPDRVVAHLGPTNSGKTYHALRRLAEHGNGVYAAPLRLLAREAYETMRGELGERVGLLTGEESENADAPILCCTAEMAPVTGGVLVLDETHWIADAERGHAWTRLLLGGWHELHLIGSADVAPLLETSFADIEYEWYERLSPLEWCGAVDIGAIEPSTVIVAFSRRNVLYLAGLLGERYRRERIGVLYGAMPIASRRTVMELVRAGEYDIVVATDVIGHGLNLPCQTVLFAETDKFDGEEMRSLSGWEAAQIAGRAGRYGNHDIGHVGILDGIDVFAPDSRVVESSLTPTIEVHSGRYGYRRIERAPIRVELSSLSVDHPKRLPRELRGWYERAQSLHNDHPWIIPEPVDLLVHRAKVLKANRLLGAHDMETTWGLVRAPLDPSSEAEMSWLAAIAAAIAGRTDLRNSKPRRVPQMGLSEAETAARYVAALRWADRAFGLEFADGELARLEGQLARRVTKLLVQHIQHPDVGRCRSCGRRCHPRFSQCDDCWRRR